MKNDNQIKIGDLVNVYWENLSTLFRVTILYTPVATGDSWRVKDENGIIYYINSFSLMERLENT